MARQWITIAKVAGSAGDLIFEHLREWSAAKQIVKSGSCAENQWPSHLREQADLFAERMRKNASIPPVVYFVEWVDLWSAGDESRRWLTPPDGPLPPYVAADRHELWGYKLPDGGLLEGHLANAGRQRSCESDWFVRRQEAVIAWDKLVDNAVLVIMRRAFDVSVFDEEITASLTQIPLWLSG